MMPNDLSRPDLSSLLSRLVEDALTPAEFEHLEQILETDSDARAVYRHHISVHAMLYWRWHNRDEGQTRRTTDAAGDMHGALTTDLDGQPPLPCDRVPFPSSSVKSFSPLLVSSGSALHGAAGSFSSSWPVAYLVAALILGIGLLVGGATHVSQPFPVATQLPSITSDKTPETQMAYIGRITGMVDCQWADDSTAAANGTRVSLGHSFALSSGLMEITYDTGARVILQGPVTYEAETRNGGFLSVGKLTARVEKKAEGGGRKAEDSNPQSPTPNPSLSTAHYPLFTIKTPTATVTDLGTEFGVEVDRDGDVVAHVFVGKVQLTAVAGHGDANREQVIVAGEAARIAANGLINTLNDAPVDDDKRFVRVMPPPERIRKSDAYGQSVLAMQPALYYRMNRPKNEKDRWAVFDSAPGGHHGEMHWPNEYRFSQPYVSGRFGDSFCLLKPPVVGYILAPDYPTTTNGQLTVSAWVFAESRPASATIATNWTAKSGQFHFGLHDVNGDLAVVLRGDDGSPVALREGAAKPLPLYQWQHVAFAADGATVRLYRNGVEVASQTCSGISRQSDVRHLAIGCSAEEPTLYKPLAITGSKPSEPGLPVEALIDGELTAADIGTTNSLGGNYACEMRNHPFVSMDFGSPLAFNTLVYSQRPGSPRYDTVSQIDLWFADSPFSLSDPSRPADATLSITEESPKLTKYDLRSAHTGRYVLAQLHMKDGMDGYAGGSALLLGSTVVAQATRISPYHFWHGRLDEIAVFDHALTAEQVRQLFAGNAVARPETTAQPDVLQPDSHGSSSLRPAPGRKVKE